MKPARAISIITIMTAVAQAIPTGPPGSNDPSSEDPLQQWHTIENDPEAPNTAVAWYAWCLSQWEAKAPITTTRLRNACHAVTIKKFGVDPYDLLEGRDPDPPKPLPDEDWLNNRFSLGRIADRVGDIVNRVTSDRNSVVVPGLSTLPRRPSFIW